MNNPWEFGWEAIAAIISVIALVLFIVVEWDRINERIDFFLLGRITFLLVLLACWIVIGYTISQMLIWWRLFALLLGTIWGVYFGKMTFIDDRTVHLGPFIVAFVALVGIAFGLWLANTNQFIETGLATP